jgi:hypothetical protein
MLNRAKICDEAGSGKESDGVMEYVGRLVPNGRQDSAQGFNRFQPWVHTQQKRTALKGREVWGEMVACLQMRL